MTETKAFGTPTQSRTTLLPPIIPRWVDYGVEVSWESEIISLNRNLPFMTQLGKIQLSVGTVNGKIIQLNDMKSGGIIEIEGQPVPFKFESPKKWHRLIEGVLWEKNYWYTIWPSWNYLPESLSDGSEKLKELRLVRPRTFGKQCMVEIVGRVKRIFPNGFVISVWSPTKNRFFSSCVMGKSQAQIRDFVRVLAHFDPKEMVLHCDSLERLKISFPSNPVQPEEIETIPAPAFIDRFEQFEQAIKVVGEAQEVMPQAIKFELKSLKTGKPIGTSSLLKEVSPACNPRELIQFAFIETASGLAPESILKGAVRDQTETSTTLALTILKTPESKAGKFAGTLKLDNSEIEPFLTKNKQFAVLFEKTEVAPPPLPKEPAKKKVSNLVPTPGRIELTVKLKQMPNFEVLQDRQIRILVEDDGNKIEILLKEKAFKKIIEVNEKAQFGWVAAISGKMKQKQGLIQLSEPNVQVFEKKEPKKAEEATA